MHHVWHTAVFSLGQTNCNLLLGVLVLVSHCTHQCSCQAIGQPILYSIQASRETGIRQLCLLMGALFAGRPLLSGQPPPPWVGVWVGVEMGGGVGPKFQHFGPPGPPPPRGAGASCRSAHVVQTLGISRGPQEPVAPNRGALTTCCCAHVPHACCVNMRWCRH